MANDRSTFSLASLFGLVTLAAVGSAALVNHNAWWVTIAVSMTLCVLVVSILCAIAARPLMRRFWIGFAVAGWGYWFIVSSGLFLSADDESVLTTRVLRHSWSQLTGEEPLNLIELVYASNYGMSVEDAYDRFYRFLKIGHALIALLLAYLAGVVTSILYAFRVRKATLEEESMRQAALAEESSSAPQATDE